jgi:hypothetical protein
MMTPMSFMDKIKFLILGWILPWILPGVLTRVPNAKLVLLEMIQAEDQVQVQV